MNNSKLKSIVSWLVLIVWMIIIFVFSSKSGSESSKQSDLALYIFNTLGLNLNGMIGDLSTFIVRKAAHFSEYLVLFFLGYNVFKQYFNNKRAILYGIMLVFLYACTDEVHQIFVPGRTAKFRDVVIDTCGSIFGAIILLIKDMKKTVK